MEIEKQILALPISQQPLVYQNPLSYLVTSLPYIDGQVDNDLKFQVEKYINQEMAVMEKKDYLKELPLPQSIILNDNLLKQEFERVRNSQQLNAIDMTRYGMTNDNVYNIKDSSKLKNLSEKTKILTQYNNIKQINLHIMEKYSPAAQKILIKKLETFSDKLKNDYSKLKVLSDEINQQRKFDQNQLNEEFQQKKDKISSLQKMNKDLKKSCVELEQECSHIRRKKMKIGQFN